MSAKFNLMNHFFLLNDLLNFFLMLGAGYRFHKRNLITGGPGFVFIAVNESWDPSETDPAAATAGTVKDGTAHQVKNRPSLVGKGNFL